MSAKLFRSIQRWTLIIGIVCGILILAGFNRVVEYTSTDAFCDRCHVHPHSTISWKQSVHYSTASGTHVHCVECHLPPKGEGYIPQKIVTGLRDVYGAIFKDTADMNWEFKSRPENAVHFTKDVSCVHCHSNIYPLALSHEGMDAHLYYEQQEGKLSCIKCHIDAGHYHEGFVHAANEEFGKNDLLPDTLYLEPAEIKEFADFTEQIPNSAVSFEMKAIPGGTFLMGAREDDAYAEPDEFPARDVTLDPFFMSETEVTWNEYLAWYDQTRGEGRTTDIGILEGVDGISGATPPYGSPDQGWGQGRRPAITMTHYAAQKYCEWLSLVSGKTYRLPTEAEWEYAARGGSSSIYFFEGEVKDFARIGIKGKLFGYDPAEMNKYVISAENSMGKTHLPSAVEANPFGLKNMLGNVSEFCLDIYSEKAYSNDQSQNPYISTGSEEYVVRGGYFMSDPIALRISNREKTNHDAWMNTDPQIPKSLWWYSDCYYVGFRVVCEYNDAE